MNTADSVKFAGALVALAICSACSGALRQAQDDMATAPSTTTFNYQYIGKTLSVNGRRVTAARPPSVLPRYAMILPDRRAKSRKFEYFVGAYVTGIFDYPKSDQEIGQITAGGGQACTNVPYGDGKKIFWIVAGDTAINEYRVLKRPIKTLSDSVGEPASCAMDASGDLAVGILYNDYGAGGGDIVIYKNATGSGTVYTTPLAEAYFDGYDNQGNLFADGFNSRENFELIELPKGSSTFETIATSNTVGFPGSVQWDGTYLTILDQLTDSIYQYTVSGTKATLNGTVSFTGSGDCGQTWIVKGLVYCADAGNDAGEVFKYPAGGSIVATFTGSFEFPLGVVAAQK
jgi:hypothetical protein